eukprot:UN02989
MATVFVQPFEVIRSRMQYRVPMQLDYRIKPFDNVRQCIKNIWQTEGIAGFYRGSAASMGLFMSGLITASVATSWSNEYRREQLKKEYTTKVEQYARQERQLRLERDAREQAAFRD